MRPAIRNQIGLTSLALIGAIFGLPGTATAQARGSLQVSVEIIDTRQSQQSLDLALEGARQFSQPAVAFLKGNSPSQRVANSQVVVSYDRPVLVAGQDSPRPMIVTIAYVAS